MIEVESVREDCQIKKIFSEYVDFSIFVHVKVDQIAAASLQRQNNLL